MIIVYCTILFVSFDIHDLLVGRPVRGERTLGVHRYPAKLSHCARRSHVAFRSGGFAFGFLDRLCFDVSFLRQGRTGKSIFGVVPKDRASKFRASALLHLCIIATTTFSNTRAAWWDLEEEMAECHSSDLRVPFPSSNAASKGQACIDRTLVVRSHSCTCR